MPFEKYIDYRRLPSTGGPNLLLRPDPGFSGGPPFELPKYDGLRRDDPPKVDACADREPPDPLAPKGMLLAPDIPAATFRAILVDSIDWSLEVVSYGNVSLVPIAGKSGETPILKNRRTLLSAEPTNLQQTKRTKEPNQPVSLLATLPAGPARNKDGVFTWLIEKVQALCGSTFVN